jgi:hypothetical protein
MVTNASSVHVLESKYVLDYWVLFVQCLTYIIMCFVSFIEPVDFEQIHNIDIHYIR